MNTEVMNVINNILKLRGEVGLCDAIMASHNSNLHEANRVKPAKDSDHESQ